MPDTMTNNSLSLPIQMIPVSKKTDKWKQKNLDRLEEIGKNQLMQNRRLIENYELIKGKFIFNHYFENNNYSDLVHQLTQEFEMPSYLRHYDIISQVINVLSGEYQKRPDNFRVKGFDEESSNEFLRTKTELLLKYVQSEINNEIQMKLLDMGLDPQKDDFNSQEEADQYKKTIDQTTQELTPPEIENYMNQNWLSVAEKWGEAQLESDRQRFDLPEKEKREFEDMLTADRCFRHFYLTGDSYNQETWNPVNTFYHKSPEIINIEEGDYVGRITYMTPASIVNMFGWKMTQSDLLKLSPNKNDKSSNKGEDGYGIAYGSTIPYANYADNKIMRETFGMDPTNPTDVNAIVPLDDGLFNSIGSGKMRFDTSGYYQVTQAYWISQKKVGKFYYIDDEGEPQVLLIDEYFIIPDGVKQVDSSIYDSDDPNTIVWTWLNETWEGVKINPLLSKEDSIYLDIKPCDFQFKSDRNQYGNRLPVCGEIFNNRNGESMSLVDLMKPHQIGYNVAMNQLYQIMQREVGRFVLMDTGMMLNQKDWGGERGWEKFMLIAKSLGFAPVDTSPANTKGANPGGQLPQMIDLDESARMMSRTKLAEFFEMQALKQVGFNQQRLGNTSASESATGVQQAMTQSFSSTESRFTAYNNFKRRCMTMNLDIAQFVQSTKDEVIVHYTKSDMSRAFMKINGTDLALRDLGIFVTNSQEDIRQLEAMRQLALNNNTSDASMEDLASIITMNSPKAIKEQLKKSRKHREQLEQQAQQSQQDQIEQATQLQREQQAYEAQENQLDRENKKEIAYINTFSRQDDNLKDADTDNTPDILEYTKLANTQKQADITNKANQEKQGFEREKFNRTQDLEKQKMAQDDRELATRTRIENKKLQIAKINKSKTK